MTVLSVAHPMPPTAQPTTRPPAVDLDIALADGFLPSTPGRTARHVVERPRLSGLLEAGARGRLALVSSSPGSGKTTALRSWLDGRPDDAGPAAWVTLTPTEDNPRTFWHTVANAVAAATETAPPGEEATESALVARLFGVLGERRSLVVVLDDFHEIGNAAILHPLSRLLGLAPEQLHLVIGTRRDPDLELHRLRLLGDVAEIRARDLAFTIEEAAELFEAEGVTVDPDQLETLVERTEGWAAGLRFAALALRDGKDPHPFVSAFDATERAVADYLFHEVLTRQEPETRAFLLRTSICDRICGALADRLNGTCDGERVLATLEQDNVFVTRERGTPWFRYHQLFAELLRTEAAYDLGEDLADVHGEAARWLAGNGDAFRALRHALAAGDASLGDELVGSLWIDIVGEGHSAVARALVEHIDAEALRRRPQLGLLAAWERLTAGELEESDAMAAAIDERASSLDDDALRAYGLGRAAVALARARATGDSDAIEAAGAELAARGGLMLTPRSNRRRRVIVACATASAAILRGDLDRAEQILEDALDQAQRLDLGECEVDAAAGLAFVYAVRGELKRSARFAHVAITAAERNGVRHERSARVVPAFAALALCAYDCGDHVSGDGYAAAGRETAAARGDANGELLVTAVQAWSIGAASPEGADAIRIQLSGLLRREAGRELAPLLVPLFAVLRSRLALAEGDLDQAEQALSKETAIGDGELRVARARVELARGELGRASELLAPVVDDEVQVVFGRARVEASVLAALIAHRRNADDEMLRALELALDLAEPDGIRAPFLDAAPGIAEPLRRLVRQGTAHRWLAAALLAAVDGRAEDAHSLPHELLEPLSERERIVLRYLPTLMSNPEIANELYLSVNTIKTHLKSIYRKLGVSHRRDAVKRARELRLIA